MNVRWIFYAQDTLSSEGYLVVHKTYINTRPHEAYILAEKTNNKQDN